MDLGLGTWTRDWQWWPSDTIMRALASPLKSFGKPTLVIWGSLEIRLGEYRRGVSSDSIKDLSVDFILRHPSYNRSALNCHSVLISLVNNVNNLFSLVNNVNALFSLVGSPQQFSNDIALVRLAEEADISVFTPVCLPNINQAGSSRVNLTVTDKSNDNICKSYSFSCQNL